MPQTVTRTDLAELRKHAVMDSLRQAGAALDELWITSGDEGLDEQFRLAEASQAVHRALIALAQPA